MNSFSKALLYFCQALITQKFPPPPPLTMTVWVCSFDGADLLQDAPSWGCLSSWFSLKCVTAKWWWWCLSYSCGCSKGCGWRSHPAHSLCNISQTKPPSHPKTMGFLPSPETSVQNNAWKWVKDFGDALLSVRIRKTKAMEDAENSNIWGNLSEHLFGQAIVTVILPISINQLCIQVSKSSISICCPEQCSELILK